MLILDNPFNWTQANFFPVFSNSHIVSRKVNLWSWCSDLVSSVKSSIHSNDGNDATQCCSTCSPMWPLFCCFSLFHTFSPLQMSLQLLEWKKDSLPLLQLVDILSLLQRICDEIKNKTLLDTCSTDKFWCWKIWYLSSKSFRLRAIFLIENQPLK